MQNCQLSQKKFLDPRSRSIRKGCDGEEEEVEKNGEKMFKYYNSICRGYEAFDDAKEN